MKKILMVLTHDRLDCLQICLEMLHKANALTAFDHVVILLNGVPPTLRSWVQQFMADHPEVSWDTLEGSGIRPQGISQIQNDCIQKYPNSLYVKVDEDLYVTEGWAERLFETYEAHKDRDDLALIAPLITNNAYGLHRLLTEFYPEKLEAFRKEFGCDPSPEPKGMTWQSPYVSDWANRQFLDLDAANQTHQQLMKENDYPRYHYFSDYFSIGCICYDYRHIERMGGVPERDEPQWCDWIEKNKQVNVLDQSQIVLHYAFFVQQAYLDRWPLLEDIRLTNLPGTSSRSFSSYHLPRYSRFAKQLPAIALRRLGLNKN